MESVPTLELPGNLPCLFTIYAEIYAHIFIPDSHALAKLLLDMIRYCLKWPVVVRGRKIPVRA